MSLLERDVVALGSGVARCDVAPHAGGAVAGFWWETGAARVDWLRAASPAAVARGDAAAMGCLPLAPYAHGIRDGRFHFCGREVAAAPDATEPHGRDGHGWRCAWDI